MRSNLVILRAGTKSLHPSWLGDAEARNWDLFISPFQPTLFAAEPGVTVGDTITGQKWTGLAVLLQNWPAGRHWSEYERVWLPDDDLFLPQARINALFDVARALNASLCAPALQEESFFSHIITMRNREFAARRTTLVEIMMPCFDARTLQRFLATLAMTKSGFGWGLDLLWPHLLGYEGVYIIDAVTALHTRPVHSARAAAVTEQARSEMTNMLLAHSVPQVVRTLAGYDHDSTLIPGDDPRFLTKLLKGWSYLWEANPGMVDAILHNQGYRK